jgi:hypothetical protein
MKYFEYNSAGVIVAYHERPSPATPPIPLAGNGLVVAPDSSLTNYYVANGTLHSKIAFTGTWNKTAIIANGADLARLRFLPDPCQMTINGDQVTVTGGRLDLTATAPGDYVVELTDVRYIYQSWVVTAV